MIGKVHESDLPIGQMEYYINYCTNQEGCKKNNIMKVYDATVQSLIMIGLINQHLKVLHGINQLEIMFEDQ